MRELGASLTQFQVSDIVLDVYSFDARLFLTVWRRGEPAWHQGYMLMISHVSL